jgi:hypothetical protein
MGVKRSRGFILTIEEDDDVSQSEPETEDVQISQNGKAKKRKIDEEMLNPEFEFDGYGALGGVQNIEDEGWDFKGVVGIKEGSGVDLEGIIARRRGNIEEDEENHDEEGSEKSEESEESEEFQGFTEDEMIGKGVSLRF